MIGNRIRQLRKEHQLTQAELGNKLGVIKQTISSWENGISSPNNETLTAMAKLFDVSTDYLLGNSGIPVSDSKPIASSSDTNILYWIQKTGYGYDEISKMLNIKVDDFILYSSGKKDIPLNVLVKLSEICDVSTDCLLGLREKSRKPTDGEMPFRFDPEISRRLKEQAAAMNESNSFLADILGIEENEVFNFFEYGFVPNIMVFVRIVEHFLVSSDYLLNRTGSTLTVQADEDDLLRSYRSLNPKSKTMALSRIYELEREESLVAAKNRYLDSEGKSSPSNGTEGGAMVG